MGAVGPTQFVVFVNGRIRTFNKSTGTPDGVLDATTDDFFPTNVRDGHGATDPRIRYDRLSGRWFLTMVTYATGIPRQNRILIASSNSGTITGATDLSFAWIDIRGLKVDGCFIDYNTLGVDANAVYIGGNIFCTDDLGIVQFSEADGFVIPKAGLLAGALTLTYFTLSGGGYCPSPGATTDGIFAPQGVDNYDANASLGYFAGISECFDSELVFARVTNPGSDSPGFDLIWLTVPPTATPAVVPALGSGTPLDDLGYARGLLAAQMRNGHLWTAQSICVDSGGTAASAGCRDAERWYDVIGLDNSSPSLYQSGTVFDPAATNPLNYWMGSIMVSGQGHAAMGSSVAGAAASAQAAYTGRLSSDSPGVMAPPTIYQASTLAYNLQRNSVQRWGDYSYTSLDPSDDMTMWTIQEFTNATDSWGVEAVKLMAPPPATPTAATTNAPAGDCNDAIEITGTSINGSGFFDPGAGFTNRIHASVSGNVTVNHVAYIDPTHIVLYVSTPGTPGGVPAGPRDVTITNPDGQSVTISGLMITVLPPSTTALSTESVVGNQQYELRNSDGATWVEMDPALRISCSPSDYHDTLLSVNADLWTRNAGFNQDIGIFASDNGGADTLVAWKESGGFAGTFSPNAAYAQVLFPMTARHSYDFKVKWKTNKDARAAGATIKAGAGPITGQFSPTSFVSKTFPIGPTKLAASPTTAFVSDTAVQDTLSGSDGRTWQPLDDPALTIDSFSNSNETAVLGANADLWTRDAGFNQDIGIFVSDNGGVPQLVGWKESGGFAGTFSPNAAFVKATFAMSAGHDYRFSLEWKTNKDARGVGATIKAGAGPIGGQFSPTSLYAEVVESGLGPYSSVSNLQYSLSGSNGSTWSDLDPSTDVSVSPVSDTNAILGANADLWTRDAGFNQDIGVFVSDNGGEDQLLAWKESGGFAGTFSPNAAFAQATLVMTTGHTYVFKLKWKTNKDAAASGATIKAGAGGVAPFSPTRLTVELNN